MNRKLVQSLIFCLILVCVSWYIPLFSGSFHDSILARMQGYFYAWYFIPYAALEPIAILFGVALAAIIIWICVRLGFVKWEDIVPSFKPHKLLWLFGLIIPFLSLYVFQYYDYPEAGLPITTPFLNGYERVLRNVLFEDLIYVYLIPIILERFVFCDIKIRKILSKIIPCAIWVLLHDKMYLSFIVEACMTYAIIALFKYVFHNIVFGWMYHLAIDLPLKWYKFDFKLNILVFSVFYVIPCMVCLIAYITEKRIENKRLATFGTH